jgi:TIR domain
MSENPKVFISHASENKKDYAEPLAAALRAKGIDAWLDKWELQAGDSLVEKIFEEGLGNAANVIFLVSSESISKPWVRAELNNAKARHIGKKLRLFPVILDSCDVPQSVIDLLWIDWNKKGSAEAVADDIAKVIYGQSDKPPLGDAPTYVKAEALRVPGLTHQDSLILGLVFEAALNGYREFVQGPEIMKYAEPKGIDYKTLQETTDLLSEQGYLIDKDQTINHSHVIVEVPIPIFMDLATSFKLPVEQCRRAVASLIINENVQSIQEIRDRASQFPKGLVDAVLDEFNDRGYCTVSHTLGGGGYVFQPTISFKRWLQG